MTLPPLPPEPKKRTPAVVSRVLYGAVIATIFSVVGLVFTFTDFGAITRGVGAEVLKFIAFFVVLIMVTGAIFSSFLEEGFAGIRRIISYLVAWISGTPEPQPEDKDSEPPHSKAIRDAWLAWMQTAPGNPLLQMSPELHAELVNSLRAKIKAESSRQLLAELRDSLSSKDVHDSIEESRSRMLERLGLERSRIARRGNFNLFIGLITTITGIVLLVMYANELAVNFNRIIADPNPRTSLDVWDYAVLFLPRLSLVALIELFSYFFLNLYKASLSEGKYLQNEITNVELRSLGLGVAVSLGDKTLGNILQSYAQTDRNQAAGSFASSGSSDDRAKLLEIVKELVKTTR